MQAPNTRAPTTVRKRSSSVLNGAGVVWVFALMFLICADITAERCSTSRSRASRRWCRCRSSRACSCSSRTPCVHGRLMRVEMLLAPLERRRPRRGERLAARVRVLGVGILLAIIVLGSVAGFRAAPGTTNEFAGVEGIFTIQVWPIKLLIVVGCAVASVELARQLVVHAGPPRAAADPRRWLAVAAVGARRTARRGALDRRGRAAHRRHRDDRARRRADRARVADRVRAVPHGLPRPRARQARCPDCARTLGLAADGTISDYVFATVPLFVLMGLFVNVSDVGRDAFRAAQRSSAGSTAGSASQPWPPTPCSPRSPAFRSPPPRSSRRSPCRRWCGRATPRSSRSASRPARRCSAC